MKDNKKKGRKGLKKLQRKYRELIKKLTLLKLSIDILGQGGARKPSNARKKVASAPASKRTPSLAKVRKPSKRVAAPEKKPVRAAKAKAAPKKKGSVRTKRLTPAASRKTSRRIPRSAPISPKPKKKTTRRPRPHVTTPPITPALANATIPSEISVTNPKSSPG